MQGLVTQYLQEKDLESWEIEYIRSKVESHNPCWRTGYIGKNSAGEKIPCSCFRRAYKHILDMRAKNASSMGRGEVTAGEPDNRDIPST